MRVCLVDTALPDSVGSMRHYADMVERALLEREDIVVSRVCVADDVSQIPPILRTAKHHSQTVRHAKRLSRECDADLVHILDGSHGYLAKHFAKQAVVVTVHDMIPLLQSKKHFAVPRPNMISRLIVRQAATGLSHADHLIFCSESTRSDFHQHVGKSKASDSVVYPPLESCGRRIKNRDHAEQRICPAETPFIFHIGNNGFYKNRVGVLRVFAMLSDRFPHKLLMAGPEPTAELVLLAKQLGIDKQVQFVINPTNEEVFAYYSHAAAFIFPSIYEGFGWPPIEAMACGCPVICSDGGSLAEVVGDAAYVVPPKEEHLMADALATILSDDLKRQEFIDRGYRRAAEFTLERFADQLDNAYMEASRNRNGIAWRRASIAGNSSP